jgi:hypothetical protein
MAKDSKELGSPVTPATVSPFQLSMPAKNAGSFKPGHAPMKGGGRPPGSLNRVTRTMKDAAVESPAEAGQVILKWLD